MRGKFLVLATICVALLVVGANAATLTSSNDTYIRDGRSYLDNGTTDNMDFRFDFTAYFQFDMSGLNIDTITDATLTLHKLVNVRQDTMVTGRVDAYGLSAISGNTEQNWDELDGGWSSVAGEDHGLDFRNVGADWLAGTGAVAANLTNLDQDNGANVTETANNTTGFYTISGPDLVAFLNGRADDNGLVTFLMEQTDGSGKGWGWATKENADSAVHPTLDLTFTAIPEPTSMALLALGGLAMLIRKR